MKQNKRELFAIIILVILALLSGGIIIYQGNVIGDLKDEISTLSKRQQMKATMATTHENVNGITTAMRGNRYVRVTAPNGGEKLCFGKEVAIKWESSGMDTVTLSVGVPGGTSYQIGTYPASFNEQGIKNGTGEIIWRVGKLLGGNLQEGFAYKITANGFVTENGIGSYLPDISDDLISIHYCEG